jgi:hypothetical protein
MLMATQMLRNRLEAIRAKRRQDPSISDETPTLLDIERTHVLFTNAHFKPFVALGYEYNKVNAGSGTVQLGGEVQFSIPQFGDFFNDMVVYMKLDQPAFSNSETLDSKKPTIRWCDYPGERVLQKVAFEVNGNPLDQYTSDATVMHRKFLVAPNKKLGWDRCMGQQVPVKGQLRSESVGAPDAHQIQVEVLNGAQTPKPQADSLQLLIPLLFWCNQDPRLAVPSVAIPYGQRFINLTLATAAQMVGYQLRGGGSASNVTLAAPNVSQLSLYINNIFVNPEIHKIFIKRIGFTLIRVHRQQNVTASLSDHEVLLQNLKWPIECMFIGLRPQSQKSHLADWHKFTKVERPADGLTLPNLVASGSTFSWTSTGTAPAAGEVVVTPAFEAAKVDYEKSTKTIDRLTISAHGIFLYNDMPSEFFHQYTTYTYGGPHINTPEDEGALMVPFNLYPGTYQPSGHVNVSRAREFYIRYVSSVIGQIENGSAVSGELVIVASAINFLLISDGLTVELPLAVLQPVHNRQMLHKLDSTLMEVNIEMNPPCTGYNCLVECY